MRRPTALLAALLLLLCLAPAAALAQDPSPTPSPEATVDPNDPDDPDDDVLDQDEIPPESTPDPERPCGGPEVDGDYAPCTPCPEATGTDADYQYCLQESAGGAEPPRPAPPAAETQPLAVRQLPLTGGNALLVALLGTGLLLTGTGLRLRLRPGGPPPSA